MQPVIIESPFAGDVKRNIEYGRRAVRDCLMRNEAPLASHLLYTQSNILDDKIPEERKLGINAGISWYESSWNYVKPICVVYADLGITPGMQQGIEKASSLGCPIVIRYIGK